MKITKQHKSENNTTMRRIALGLALVWIGIVSAPLNAESSDEEKSEVKWHKSFLTKARHSLGDLDELADTQWRRFQLHMGFGEPRHIAAYRGYGNSTDVWVRGRLLGDKPYGGPKDDDDWWDNIQATYQRWESDEIPDAKIKLTYGEQSQEVITDNEGYYSARFKRDTDYPYTDVITAQHALDDRVLIGYHKIYFASPDAEFMVISDMDDTVIHTGITSLLTAAQLTFLRNAKTRKPLTGVSQLYRSLANGTQDNPVNPVFYVSNSAWNMYDLLRDFLDLNELPSGPVMLRDIGLSSDSEDHKITTVRSLIEQFPNLPAILVGDSGQHDAEIYATVAREYPDRVAAIYIRDVDPEEDSEYDGNVDTIIQSAREVGVPFIRVSDSGQIAAHAAEIGLLPSGEIDDVETEVAIDKRRDTLAEAAIELNEESGE